VDLMCFVRVMQVWGYASTIAIVYVQLC